MSKKQCRHFSFKLFSSFTWFLNTMVLEYLATMLMKQIESVSWLFNFLFSHKIYSIITHTQWTLFLPLIYSLSLTYVCMHSRRDTHTIVQFHNSTRNVITANGTQNYKILKVSYACRNRHYSNYLTMFSFRLLVYVLNLFEFDLYTHWIYSAGEVDENSQLLNNTLILGSKT